MVLALQPVAIVTDRLVGGDDGAELRMRPDGWSGVASDGQLWAHVSDLSEPVLLAFRRAGEAPVVLSLPPLSSGEDRDLGEIRLDGGRAVIGRVLGDDKTPIAGAAVTVAEPWTRRLARTDGTGRFCLLRMPLSASWVRVNAEVWPPHFFRIDADGVELRLSAGGIAEGLGRASIRPAALHELAENAEVDARPDPDGRFRVRLQPGEYRGWTTDEAKKRASFSHS